MAVISFQVPESDNPQDQARLIGRMKSVTGVRTLGQIDADSPDNDISRMWFAEAIDAHHVSAIVEQLDQLVGAENISVEPRRELIP